MKFEARMMDSRLWMPPRFYNDGKFIDAIKTHKKNVKKGKKCK